MWDKALVHHLGYRLGMLIFEKFKSRILIPGNSIESRRVSQLCGYRLKEKIMVGVARSWLVHTGMATSNNIFVPFVHSMAESPSQVHGQMCSPRELVKPATRHTQ